VNEDIKPANDNLSADAHVLETDLPGDVLGGGLGNSAGGEPASDG
jgi:hypothetical protein